MKRLIWNRHTKLLLRNLAGWFFIALGIIMLVTPGQGILSILIGIYLLADHVPMLGKLKIWLQHKFPKTADYAHRTSTRIKNRLQRK